MLRNLALIICMVLLVCTVGITGAAEDDNREENESERVIGQSELITLLYDAPESRYEYFIKDSPIAIYEYDGDRSVIPVGIGSRLGATDQTEYNEQYFSDNAIIALQFDGDEPDFYIIGQDVFSEQYRLVNLSEVIDKNSKLFAKITQHESVANLVEAQDERLKGAVKLSTVKMVKVSTILGRESIREEVTIEAPWGGTQTKEARNDAYFVAGDSEVYIVNAGKNRLPIGYVRK